MSANPKTWEPQRGVRVLATLVWLTLSLASCSTAGSLKGTATPIYPPATSTPSASLTPRKLPSPHPPTLTPSASLTPSRSPSPLPPTFTLSATLTSSISPSPLPSDESRFFILTPRTPTVELVTKYYDPVFGISLYYPSSWKRVGDREFKGDSGYLKLSDLPDYHSIRTAHVCDDYAYIHYPGKQIFVNSGTSSCVVLPQYYTPKVIGEAFGIFQYKSKAQDYHYFLLETTHQYFLKIYESVVRDEPPFVPYSSFSPTPQPLHRDTKVVDIDEIFIIEANLDEEHSDMGSWEDPLFSDRKHNKDLLYARTRGNRLSSYRYEHCGGGESINIGDSTLVVDYGIFGVEVRQDGNIIFTMMISPAPFSSVWAFCEWNGSWILETTDFVIQDGQILNHKLGYDQMFGWNILAGKPFYFFTQNGVVRIWYDGQVLPVKYDYVFHYGCCEGPSFYNPGCTDRKAFFFGVRDGIWYHVEILIKWPYE